MKQSIVLIFLLCAAPLFAQDKSTVTVKDAAVSNGVVVVSIDEAGKPFELQCNQRNMRCSAAQPGSYWMVRLPKNHGLYDCDNVDLYAQSANTDNADNIVGEYCISGK